MKTFGLFGVGRRDTSLIPMELFYSDLVLRFDHCEALCCHRRHNSGMLALANTKASF
jgi:hypothetical protein